MKIYLKIKYLNKIETFKILFEKFIRNRRFVVTLCYQRSLSDYTVG